MKNKLKILLVQTNLFWKDKQANLLNIELQLSSSKDVDIILLPEMFNTGFCPAYNYLAEPMNGETIKWMLKISKKKKSAVAGSLMIKDGPNIFNRLIWISKNGIVKSYDKRHLFSLINEDKYISKGDKRLIVREEGWKICPLICYDLRFPVFSRNNVEYDVLIFLANWPEKRIDAWKSLLKARAIENQCYSIGVNITGNDGLGVSFNGNSLAFNPLGNNLNKPNCNNNIIYLIIEKNSIISVRKKLNFLNDRDKFKLLNIPN